MASFKEKFTQDWAEVQAAAEAVKERNARRESPRRYGAPESIFNDSPVQGRGKHVTSSGVLF